MSSVTPGREVTGTAGAAPTGTQIAEGILAALTDIRTATFFEPDAIIVNPSDWNTIRLAKATTGEYLGGSFFGYSSGQGVNEGTSFLDPSLTLWGKRVVSTPAIPVKLYPRRCVLRRWHGAAARGACGSTSPTPTALTSSKICGQQGQKAALAF